MRSIAKQKIIEQVREIKYFFFIFFIISLNAFTIEKCHAQAISVQSYKLPLTFEKNEGQVHTNANYFSRGNGYAIYFHPQEIVMSLRNCSSDQSSPFSQLKIQLLGAQNNPSISGKGELQTKSNYLIGNQPNQWRTNIPNFSKVYYKGVYPGIDAVFYGNQNQLEYDFCVAPGADPKQARLHIEGADKIDIDDTGNLQIAIDRNKVLMNKPIVYQIEDDKQIPIEGNFVLLAENEVTFEIGNYDSSKMLVIDPIISYSTFLGGSGRDGGVNMGIAVDCEGNSYVCGQTNSPNYPLVDALQSQLGGGFDACVTKINPEGTAIVFSTYLGGSNFDAAYAIALDCCNNIYLTGQTFSPNFPGTGSASVQPSTTGFQTQIKGTNGNAFLTKLDASGTKILYSTYCGGLGTGGGGSGPGTTTGDLGSAITVDKEGNAYFTGSTTSLDFPITPGAFQTTYGGGDFDAFITKVDTKETGQASLIYSTYLGGNQIDRAFGIAIDCSGNAYVVGQTQSQNFPVVNAIQPIFSGGARDCFLTKINSIGTELIFSTFCGANGNDRAFGVALDRCGNIYMTGITNSTAGSNPANPNFPSTSGAFQQFLLGNRNGFITKFNPDASVILASTYFGGNPISESNSIAVDCFGNPTIVGFVVDSLTTKNPSQPNYGGGGSDAFVAKLTSDLRELIFSTYLGGSNDDDALAVALDRNGNAYVAGTTPSVDFPTTPEVFQPTYGGGILDMFVTKYLIGTPFIKCLSPHEGFTTKKTTVIIRGNNFNNVLNVFFGEIQAAKFVVVSENEIIAESPVPGTGTVDVTVETVGGTSLAVCASQFTYKAFPPKNLFGFQKKRRNCVFDILEWDAPSEGLATFYYQVATDPEFNNVIGTIPGKCEHIVFKTEPCRLRKSNTYFVRTVDVSLNASDFEEVAIKPAKQHRFFR